MAERDSISASEEKPVEYREYPNPMFPTIRVGDDGTVWRILGSQSATPGQWRQIHGATCNSGYKAVMLRKKKKIYVIRIHRMVLETFVGPCPAGMEACHDPDNDPTNNRIENLRWGTRKENAQDRVRLGTQIQGAKHPLAKLTDADIARIRSADVSRYGAAAKLAREYNVSHATIHRVINRILWRHV